MSESNTSLPNNIQPGSMKTITDSKLVNFAVGQQKKSRFQKSREEKEAKKKQDEEEAAKVYDSFVASFGDGNDDQSKTFVRGGKVLDNGRDIAGGRVGEVYKLERPKSDMEKLMEEMKDRDSRGGKQSSSRRDDNRDRNSQGSHSGGNKREIDNFLSEIKTRIDGKKENLHSSSDYINDISKVDLEALGMEKGSFDNGDPNTTNLYVGNLSPTTTEEHLLELFRKCGVVNSVKIMWPRTDEEKSRKRNCGFVSFKKREDAEFAREELNDYDLNEYKMIVGWGKAVKISATPFSLPPKTASDIALSSPFLMQPQTENIFPTHGLPYLPDPPIPVQMQYPPFMQPPMGLFDRPPMPGLAPPPLTMPMFDNRFIPHMVPPPFGDNNIPRPPPGYDPPAIQTSQIKQPPPPTPPHISSMLAKLHQESIKLEEATFAPSAEEFNAVIKAPVPPPAIVTESGFELSSFMSSVLSNKELPKEEKKEEKMSPHEVISNTNNLKSDLISSVEIENLMNSIINDSQKEPVPQHMIASGLPIFPQPQQHMPPFHNPSQYPMLSNPPLPMNISNERSKWDIPPPMLEIPLDPHPSQPLRDMSGMKDGDQFVTIMIPSDPKIRSLIDLTASYVAADGDAFEKVLKSKEEENIDYLFLFQPESMEGYYYRWRTFAYCMGDTDTSWRDSAFRIAKDGLFLVPPLHESKQMKSGFENKESSSERVSHENRHDRDRENDRDRNVRRRRSRSRSGERRRHNSYANKNDDNNSYHSNRKRSRSRSRSGERRKDRDRDRRRRSNSRSRSRSNDRIKYAGMTGAQIERARAKEKLKRLARLSAEDFEEWKVILKHLTLSRDSIKHAMGFAFDKIESAEEIIQMIHELLIEPANHSAAVKISALYLLSDILHNSGTRMKNASSFRSLIQNILPESFESMGACFRQTITAKGRMSAFQVEERIKKLFQCWSQWSIFPTLFLTGLQASFYRSENDIIQAQVNNDNNINNNNIESIKKQARLYGVAIRADSTTQELMMKINMVDMFLKRSNHNNDHNRSNSSSNNNNNIDSKGNKMLFSEEGLPMMSSIGRGKKLLDKLVEDEEIEMNKNASYRNDDDDIDGIPMVDDHFVNYNNNSNNNNKHSKSNVFTMISDNNMDVRLLEESLLVLRDQLEANGRSEQEIEIVLMETRRKQMNDWE
eukprot:gene14491-19453_t